MLVLVCHSCRKMISKGRSWEFDIAVWTTTGFVMCYLEQYMDQEHVMHDDLGLDALQMQNRRGETFS